MAETKGELTEIEDRILIGILYYRAEFNRSPYVSEVAGWIKGCNVFRANGYINNIEKKGYLKIVRG